MAQRRLARAAAPLEARVAPLPARLTPRQAARRERILRAAMELASRGGYEAVQMRAVAARARVALGTLYRYYASKDGLLMAVHAEWTRKLLANIQARPPQGATAADKVVDIVRRGVRAFEREPRLAQALVMATFSPDPALLASRVERQQLMTEILSFAMEGVPREEQEQIAWILSLVWYADLVAWVTGVSDTTRMARDLEHAARLLLRGRR